MDDLEVSEAQPVSRRRILTLEVAAVSSLIVLPALASATLHYNVGSNSSTKFDFGTIVYDILLRVGVPAVILFVLWASGDALKRFGIVKWEWAKDLPLTIFTFGVMVLTLYAYRFIRGRDVWPSHSPPSESLWLRYALIAVYYFFVGLREELFYRGYLIPRLAELSGKTAVGVIVSALLFGLQHLYQGWQSALLTVVHAVLLAGLFLARRSIWPLVLAHAAYDFYITFMNYH